MERRTLLGAVGGVALSAVAAVDLFAPELIIGSPQAEGDPISTERTVTDDDIEYDPDSDTVRWPRLVHPEGPDDYTVEPFENWASRHTASVARGVIEPVLAERIDGELDGVGLAVSGEYLGLAVSVWTVTPRGEDGELGEPEIPRSTLVDAAPRHIETTLRLDGREYTRDVPVFVEEQPPMVPA